MGNSEKGHLPKPLDYELIVRREAQFDVREAFDYYEEKSQGLGFEFMRSLDAVLQSVKRNPHSYQQIYKEIRRVLLRKFPYALFYLTAETKIIVVAVLHQSRSEIDWIRRS